MNTRGLRIPDDLGIVGFDDIEMTAWPSYAITTVRQPVDQMVDTTIEVLLNAIDNPDIETVTKWIPASLVERNSTRAVKPRA
jgi:DNA-binding LacI/PurR family transcriptional regulator